MDIEQMYRQVDTPELVSRWAREVNAAEVIPDPEGKHLLTLQARERGQVDADITIKTHEGAEIIYVTMSADVWDVLPALPGDFFGDEGDDDD